MSELLNKNESGWKKVDNETKIQIFNFADDYMNFFK